MSWGTKEQKGDVLLAGVNGAVEIFKAISEKSNDRHEQAIADGNITMQEYEQLRNDYEEYKTYIDNIITDSELGCKLKRTEEIFLMIIRIIMFDLEFDYPEVISNFTKAIDTEEFIQAHDLAVQKREERLDKEYQDALREYEIELREYQLKLDERKSKSFLSRMFSEEIPKPEKPERRE